MAERPNDKRPDEPVNPNSGWRTPKQAAAPEERHAWRPANEDSTAANSLRVPTLPRDLDANQPGGWHVPQPQDTTISPEDVSEIVAPTEDQVSAPTEDKVAPAGEAETQPGDVLPFDGAVTAAPSPEPEASTALEPVEEDEDDSFSMSELVALASLVDHVPSVEVQPARSVPASSQLAEPVAGTSDSDDALDAAAYARRELERLQAPPTTSQPSVAVAAAEPAPQDAQPSAEPSVQPTGVVSPQEYARQQLALLGAAAQPAQSPAAPAGTPPLADKFRRAEDNIRALRQQYQQGQITRDQFQADLRREMVLDDNSVWWMMGVESDRWYRHENNQWIPATPPTGGGAAIVPTDADSEGDRTVPTSPVTNQWVPRQVPVRDPDFTVPNTGGIYLDNDYSADTMPMATIPSAVISGATVPNPAIQQSQYESVAAPMAAEQAPVYDVETASPAYEEAVARQRQSTVRTVAIIAAIIAALLFLLAGVGAIGIVIYYNSLASPYRDAIAGLASYQPQFRTARILAADGSLIAELTSPQGGARDVIDLSNVAPEFVSAVVSAENERFFQDPGWDPVAIVRAFAQNLTSGQVESGASTITQQIARNLILQDTTVSPTRKLQEIVIAAEIARRYDKNFILQLYLNEVFFGNQSYGVEAASKFYFGHGAADLNLPEAAMLAGLIQAPAAYDPVINRQAAFDRMEFVLNRMATVGCLQFSFAPYDKQPFCVTKADVSSSRTIFQKAQIVSRDYHPRTFTVKYPHFVNFVQQQIENNFGTSEMYRRGFEIRTTLNPRIQDTAQNALEAQVKALVGNGINTGTVMVTDPRDGAIRAMVGSPDFSDNAADGQINYAFTWQQPGSSIKIVEYTGALEGVNRNGTNDYLTTASILWDVPTTFQNPDYSPVNYDRNFHGPVTVRTALANSYNVPAVKVLNYVGLDKFVDVAQRIGLRFLPEATFGLSSALGANEVRLYDMMQAYGTFANNGTRVPLYSITAIKDASGAAVDLPARPQPALAVQPQVAFLIQSILSDNEARTPAFGANSPLNVNGYPGLVAAKTGTSNDNRDLWTMGFSSNVVVGVWLGRVDNAPTNNTSGLAAAPVWNAVMSAALQGLNPQPFAPPPGIVQQQICSDTGTVYDPNVPCTVVRTDYFIQSELPPPASQGFVQTVPVDTWTGLRANQFCPDSVVTQTFVNINDPSAVAWLNTPQGLSYAQSIRLPIPPKAAPTGECTTSTILPQVHFTGPANGQQLTGAVQFTGIVSGPNFDHYQIELSPATSPDAFQVIVQPIRSQANGNLATWDTTTVPNGAYRLRLSAFATDGGYRYATIDIGVNNLIPTQPPPTLPPLVVPTSAPGSTTIPFSNQLAPTPTIFLGG